MKFTDKYVKSLKPKETRYDVNAGDGFVIRVFPSGAKSWLYVYRLHGRLRRMTLGTYPAMSLKKAKSAHAEAYNLRHNDHIDPGQQKHLLQAEEVNAPTVNKLALEYIKRHAKLRKRSWEEDQRMLEKDVLPYIGKYKVSEVTRRDIIAILDRIIDRGAGVVANRTFEVIRRMFNFAIERSIIENTPCYMVKAPGKETQRERVLSPEEIRRFWRRLYRTDMSQPVRLALKLQLVTAQRRGEIIQAEWKDFDLATGWWTIPAEKSKNKKSHRIPLSPVAIALLRHIKRRSGNTPWLFPNPSRKGLMAEGAPTRALARNLGKLGIDHFTPHDIRRTAASQMASIGTPRLVISKILNHTESGITAVYDRHSYDAEKRAALESWAEHLQNIVARKES
jgi:integrase